MKICLMIFVEFFFFWCSSALGVAFGGCFEGS